MLRAQKPGLTSPSHLVGNHFPHTALSIPTHPFLHGVGLALRGHGNVHAVVNASRYRLFQRVDCARYGLLTVVPEGGQLREVWGGRQQGPVISFERHRVGERLSPVTLPEDVEGSRGVELVVGVDTHQDEHVAVAIDRQGVRLGELHTVATTHGYEELERWSRGLGEIHAFGIEGTGSYGAGVARFLTSRDYNVVEVNRPDRSTRYRKGKSDPTDAEMAARAVLAGVADATPKSGEGEVEMIRMLKSAKDSAVKARTQAINQMKALVVTAPAELRETLDGLAAGALVTRCKSFRTGRLDGPLAAARYTLRSLARRYRQLSEEVRDLEAELDRLTRTAAPALVDGFGIGPDTAATLLIAAGSNPDRLHSEAAFASLCGVNPIPASSGKTNRHRLNRGGHRQANAALHRIVVVRLRHDERTQAYMRRRTTEGMSKAEVIRCLKRYVAREVFSSLRNSALSQSTP